MYLDDRGEVRTNGAKPLIHVFDHVVCDRAETDKIGAPQFKEVPHIKIKFRGQHDYITRRLCEEDKQNYPEAWARYQAEKMEAASLGAPLDKLPAFTAAIAAELKSLGIQDIETLATAEVEEHHAKIQKQAKAYIAMMEDDGED